MVAVKAQQQANRHKETKYFDLVVKRKAMSQPMDSFINWQQEQKKVIIGRSTGKSITELETALPPLCGKGASFSEYIKEEFNKVANGLLQMVGGSIGRPCMEHQKVVIAIGLAKFSSMHGPPTLNSSFEAFFTNEAHSLSYLVVGVNEYYLLKWCPICNNFVSQTSEWHALYCHTCKHFRQRDTMVSDNMNIVIKGHLKDQQ
ncbi:hypothetical protein BG005_008994 [Podila minutissima]|nr:hypothetical protein BG005_008994 [Podila minutissima]